jgi:MHS family proline/betaine transporter-like MFS transporter
VPKPSEIESHHRRRIVYAGMVGNALEWYDFAIYGFLATYIARNFFPQDDPTAGVLAAFTVFAIGYVMRPLGGIVIGHIGDRFSRRAALILSISLMSVSTFLIGILPGHATLGIAAPICLTLIRVLQGLSAGGDSSSSAVFLIENADQHRRGLYGSFITIGNLTGILLGSATPIVVSSLISTTAMDSWGWRLPFLLGSVIGIVGYVLRRQIEVDARRGPAASAPVVEAFRTHSILILRLLGLCVVNAVFFNIVFIYAVSWLQEVDGIAPATALEINTINMVLLIPVLLISGLLSDRIGRKPVLIGSMIALIVLAWPLFYLMHHPDPMLAFLGQLGFVPPVAFFLGSQQAALNEAVPSSVRCTTSALTFNLTIGFFGGTAPAVALWLVQRTGYDLAPAIYIIIATAIGLIAALGLKETFRDPLPD